MPWLLYRRPHLVQTSTSSANNFLGKQISWKPNRQMLYNTSAWSEGGLSCGNITNWSEYPDQFHVEFASSSTSPTFSTQSDQVTNWNRNTSSTSSPCHWDLTLTGHYANLSSFVIGNLMNYSCREAQFFNGCLLGVEDEETAPTLSSHFQLRWNEIYSGFCSTSKSQSAPWDH